MRLEMGQFFTEQLWRKGEVTGMGGVIGWPIALSRQDKLGWVR
jgi:hypothetical protein